MLRSDDGLPVSVGGSFLNLDRRHDPSNSGSPGYDPTNRPIGIGVTNVNDLIELSTRAGTLVVDSPGLSYYKPTTILAQHRCVTCMSDAGSIYSLDRGFSLSDVGGEVAGDLRRSRVMNVVIITTITIDVRSQIIVHRDGELDLAGRYGPSKMSSSHGHRRRDSVEHTHAHLYILCPYSPWPAVRINVWIRSKTTNMRLIKAPNVSIIDD